MEGEGPPTETSPSAFLPVLEGKLGWWPRPGCSAQAGAGFLTRTPTSPGQARPALSHSQGGKRHLLGILEPRLTSASAHLVA